MKSIYRLRAPAWRVLGATLLCGLVGAVASAADAGYPTHAIKFIVPYAPGGTTDSVARLYAEQLGRRLGQPLVVENRPGASTNIAGQALSKAEPNGYTLMLGTNQAIINTVFGPAPAFDPVNGFAPVALVAEVPFVLAVDARSPAQSVRDLLPKAGGVADLAVAHAQFEPQLKLMSHALGTPLLSVPFQGGSQALTAVLGGEVPAVLSGLSAVAPMVKAGKLRLVGVASAKRVMAFPDRPTFVEQGYPGFVTSGWMSVLAPKGTPEAVLRRLGDASLAVSKDPAYAERIRGLGAEPLEGGAADTATRMQAERTLWSTLLR